jgi:CPA1 family monovalent cation:H+ antiporter
VLENSLSLVTPFLAYFLAEEVHASGVLAVVVAGLYLGHHESKTSYAVRLQARAIWRMVDFVLESVVFALIGLQLRAAIRGIPPEAAARMAWGSALVLVLVIVVRIAWIFPYTYGPRWLSRRVRERDPSPPWRSAFVVSWAGMRGVVSLAAAFALGDNFPQGNLILVLTSAVVFGTLVIHGFSLPWVIRRLGVSGDDDYQDRLTEAGAQHRAAGAAIARLDQLVTESDPAPPPDVVERLRVMTESRRNAAWERLGGAAAGGSETPSAAYRRLRLAMLESERQTFLELRDAGRIEDQVLRSVIYELDLEEAMLVERA